MRMQLWRVALSVLLLGITYSMGQQRTVGLLAWDPQKAYVGYTLFPGKHVGTTALIDMNGYVVHSWNSSYEPGQSAYLLPNGNLLRCALLKTSYSIGGGEGGRFEMYNWSGTMTWGFDYASPNYMSHHDAKVLPNGNLLAMAVEKKTKSECAQAGFDTTLLQEGYVSAEYLIEFRQNGAAGYDIVWEWHLWDHLIQDRDPSKNNFGVVKEHPELNDVASSTGSRVPAFWNHANSIDYNAKFDQLCISIRGNSEFWIIDHSTTTAEAASHSGGRYGKGGDILYRWGNPQAYDRGTAAHRILYQQHDAQWIPDGCPGAGHIIFNNGIDRPGTKFSSIEEMVLPCDTNGVFPVLEAHVPWTPATSSWTYTAPNPADFYSPEISGVQRLPNGNTLVCEGLKGHLFEVTSEKQIVWRYISPLVDKDTLSQGDDPASDIDPRGHQNNAVFKVHRYAPTYAGLVGKDLTPIAPLEKNPWPDITATTKSPLAQRISSPQMSLKGLTISISHLKNATKPSIISIYTLSGALVTKKQIASESFTWHSNHAGCYLINVKTGHETFRYQAMLAGHIR